MEGVNFLDADLDGNDDIIVGWEDGKVEIINHELELVYSRQFPKLIPHDILVNDLNNNGKKKIIISGNYFGTQVILVLNRQLELLAYLNGYAMSPQIVKTGFGNEKWVLAWDKTTAVFFNLKKQYPIFFEIFWKWIGYGFFIGLILTGIFSVILCSKRNWQNANLTLNSTINSIPDGLLVLDLRGVVIAINRQLEQIINIDRIHLLGQFYENVFPDPNFNELKQIIKFALKNKFTYEEEISILQNSTARSFLIGVGHLTIKKRKHLLVSLKDITDIIQSKRTIAWATMAQKLAHEIKTPLVTIGGYSRRALKSYERGNNISHDLNVVIKEISRLEGITDGVLDYSKKRKLSLKVINLNSLISETIEILQSKLTYSEIEVEMRFSESSLTVKADKDRLKQVLFNIFDNAIQAMPNGGKLTVNTCIDNGYCRLTISDTGHGMTQETKDNLFKPFFTTKDGGSGLGLAVSRKIVADHGGYLEVSATSSEGSSFTVSLPATKKEENT